MDDLVKQAMSKWPNVPACYGWLGLDARGNWYMRDDAVQALGPFKQSKGSKLSHDKLIAFIARNYMADETGQWYFQNGPQRVFIELEETPWIWRIQHDLSVMSHTELPARIQRIYLDELGRLYLETDLGIGLIHTQDMVHALEPIESGLWVPEEVLANDVPEKFKYVKSPQSTLT